MWVLIIAFISPGGDFMDKVAIEYPSEKQCIIAMDKLPTKAVFGTQKGICVTHDHYTGKKKMSNVEYD